MDGQMLMRIARDAGTVLSIAFREGEKHIDEHTASGDADSQLVIVRALYRRWPHVPIVVEEGLERIVQECKRACPDVKLVTIPKVGGLDTVVPPECFIVDPRDGSAIATNGCPEYAVSIGYQQNGRPVAGALWLPELESGLIVDGGTVEFVGARPRKVPNNEPRMSLIGLDLCKDAPPEFRGRVILPLVDAFRYIRNLPSVASGWELVVGRTRAWVTDRSMIWDVAVVAPAILAQGGVVECLDGSPVPWDRPKMPPLLFADSREVADYVRLVLRR